MILSEITVPRLEQCHVQRDGCVTAFLGPIYISNDLFYNIVFF